MKATGKWLCLYVLPGADQTGEGRPRPERGALRHSVSCGLCLPRGRSSSSDPASLSPRDPKEFFGGSSGHSPPQPEDVNPVVPPPRTSRRFSVLFLRPGGGHPRFLFPRPKRGQPRRLLFLRPGRPLYQESAAIDRMEVKKRKRMRAEPKIRMWKLKDEDCGVKYRDEVRQVLGNGGGVLDTWDETSNAMRDVARKVLGVTSGQRKIDKELWWWTEEVQESLRGKRLTKKNWDFQ
ncbi:uncharacterized protein LOC143482001 [Brachyhypopomus gauderio]|uniref:uncharacterized protein LOC143482001 n=1 Tax=Brachyhypopomus gauderio TaxID=698409 RepID=UPI004042753B